MLFTVLKAIESQLPSVFSLPAEQYIAQDLSLKSLSYLSEQELYSLWYTLGIILAFFFFCLCVNIYLFVLFGLHFKFHLVSVSSAHAAISQQKLSRGCCILQGVLYCCSAEDFSSLLLRCTG